MKVLVIPDVHLKPWMFEQAEQLLAQGAAERAVCLMDLPDDWWQEYNIPLYKQTFDAAIAFAVCFPETLWVYGNHDLCYYWNERESGYSIMATRTVCEKLLELKETLPEDNEIRYVQKIDRVLFCHGGLLDAFVKHVVPPEQQQSHEAVLAAINDLTHASMWNDASPLWYRPQYSAQPLYAEGELWQVVGHTPVATIEQQGSLISCDTFSTYSNGTPIGTQEFLIIDTISGEWKGSAGKASARRG